MTKTRPFLRAQQIMRVEQKCIAMERRRANEATAYAEQLREALESVSHYFYGEHHPDHPTCKRIRAALAKNPTNGRGAKGEQPDSERTTSGLATSVPGPAQPLTAGKDRQPNPVHEIGHGQPDPCGSTFDRNCEREDCQRAQECMRVEVHSISGKCDKCGAVYHDRGNLCDGTIRIVHSIGAGDDHRCIWRERYDEVAAEVQKATGRTPSQCNRTEDKA